MNFVSRFAAVTLAALLCWTVPASSQQAPPPQPPPSTNTYGPDELVGAGHRFFGNVSRGLASVIERAVSQWGLPNGYVLGEEGSGAFVAGLRYGEGTLYTKNAGDRADRQRHRTGADPLRPWATAWRQYRLSQIYPARDLEPVLIAPGTDSPKARNAPGYGLMLTRHQAGVYPVAHGIVINGFLAGR